MKARGALSDQINWAAARRRLAVATKPERSRASENSSGLQAALQVRAYALKIAHPLVFDRGGPLGRTENGDGQAHQRIGHK
jgi:hypothetical protein